MSGLLSKRAFDDDDKAILAWFLVFMFVSISLACFACFRARETIPRSARQTPRKSRHHFLYCVSTFLHLLAFIGHVSTASIWFSYDDVHNGFTYASLAAGFIGLYRLLSSIILIIKAGTDQSYKAIFSIFMWQMTDLSIFKHTYNSIHSRTENSTIYIIKQMFTWLETAPLTILQIHWVLSYTTKIGFTPEFGDEYSLLFSISTFLSILDIIYTLIWGDFIYLLHNTFTNFFHHTIFRSCEVITRIIELSFFLAIANKAWCFILIASFEIWCIAILVWRQRHGTNSDVLDPLILFFVLPQLGEVVGQTRLFIVYYLFKVLELIVVTFVSIFYLQDDHLSNLNMHVLQIGGVFASIFVGFVLGYVSWGLNENRDSASNEDSSYVIPLLHTMSTQHGNREHILSYSGPKMLLFAIPVTCLIFLSVAGFSVVFIFILLVGIVMSPFIMLLWMCNKREGLFGGVFRVFLRWAYSWLFWVHILSIVVVNLFQESPKYVIDVSELNSWEDYMKKNISKSGRRRINKYVKKAMTQYKIEKEYIGTQWRMRREHWSVFFSHVFRLNQSAWQRLGVFITMPYRMAWAFFFPWELEEYRSEGKLVGFHLMGNMSDRQLCAGIFIHTDFVKSMIYWDMTISTIKEAIQNGKQYSDAAPSRGEAKAKCGYKPCLPRDGPIFGFELNPFSKKYFDAAEDIGCCWTVVTQLGAMLLTILEVVLAPIVLVSVILNRICGLCFDVDPLIDE